MQRLVLGALILITVAVIVFLAAMFWLSATNPAGQVSAGPSEERRRAEIGPSGLAIPVAGVGAGQLADTFTQARGGGGRPHDAIDIMAPRDTLVVAAAEGMVEKLFFSGGGGGITAYVRSPDRRWVYYYAHLDAYAPGLREGGRVRRGDPIGRVGSTGNANPAGPHLHFAIHRVGPDESWWRGRAVNPYPLLAGRGPPR
ncbi:MAG TPA: M23 family metallopeptidase [Allosphingosinicella sp.]|nr:M23 family metallopeptidase [Allosphingosinicella sp.]